MWRKTYNRGLMQWFLSQENSRMAVVNLKWRCMSLQKPWLLVSSLPLFIKLVSPLFQNYTG